MFIKPNTKTIQLGKEYFFTKSMNKVKTVEILKNDNWIVERVDTKKQMFVNSRSLVKEEDLEEHDIFLETNV